MFFGNRVERHKTDIVPVHLIGLAGIAEADEKKHGRPQTLVSHIISFEK
jgi:hypothetical protein